MQFFQYSQHQRGLSSTYLPNHSYFLIVSEVKGDVSKDRVMVGVRLVLDVVVRFIIYVFSCVSIFLDAPLGIHLV